MRLLFTSGTARGGTNFRTLILDGHQRVCISLDPFIPLFRFYISNCCASIKNWSTLVSELLHLLLARCLCFVLLVESKFICHHKIRLFHDRKRVLGPIYGILDIVNYGRLIYLLSFYIRHVEKSLEFDEFDRKRDICHWAVLCEGDFDVK